MCVLRVFAASVRLTLWCVAHELLCRRQLGYGAPTLSHFVLFDVAVVATCSGLWIGDAAGNHVASLSYNSTALQLGSARTVSSGSYQVFYRSAGTTGLRLSCADHYAAGARTNGVYVIDRGMGSLSIYCDMTTSGGGWDLVVNSVNQLVTVRAVQRSVVVAVCSPSQPYLHATCSFL